MRFCAMKIKNVIGQKLYNLIVLVVSQEVMRH